MSKKKDITYNEFQALIKNKDTAVNYYVNHYLDVCQSMFNYTGLPETIPQRVLEKQLQTNGNVFFVLNEGKLYALTGATGGEPNEYYEPTEYIITNPYLNLNKTYKIGIDGVLMRNDSQMRGLMPIIGKYAVLLTDSGISLNTATILTRITMLISASDDKTKASADLFLNKILNGDFSVIGENSLFNGVKLQTAPTSNSVYVSQLIELVQYYKAGLLNELGLNANWNAKRERLVTDEVNTNIDVLLPFVDNMLSERKKAVEEINKMFNTEITVTLASAWLSTHETKEHTDESKADESKADESKDDENIKDDENK